MYLRRILLLLTLFAIAVAGVIFVLRTTEPSYHGRTLTGWLQQCYDTPLMESEKLGEAQGAVRAIGAEKALPFLLEMAEARDGLIVGGELLGPYWGKYLDDNLDGLPYWMTQVKYKTVNKDRPSESLEEIEKAMAHLERRIKN